MKWSIFQVLSLTIGRLASWEGLLGSVYSWLPSAGAGAGRNLKHMLCLTHRELSVSVFFSTVESGDMNRFTDIWEADVGQRRKCQTGWLKTMDLGLCGFLFYIFSIEIYFKRWPEKCAFSSLRTKPSSLSMLGKCLPLNSISSLLLLFSDRFSPVTHGLGVFKRLNGGALDTLC